MAGTCIKTTTSNTKIMTLAIIQRIVFKAIRPNRPNCVAVSGVKYYVCSINNNDAKSLLFCT